MQQHFLQASIYQYGVFFYSSEVYPIIRSRSVTKTYIDGVFRHWIDE